MLKAQYDTALRAIDLIIHLFQVSLPGVQIYSVSEIARFAKKTTMNKHPATKPNIKAIQISFASTSFSVVPRG